MAVILEFGLRGWCVRSGTSAAHYFVRQNGRSESVCGLVSNPAAYTLLRSRPLQANKPHCVHCLRELRRAEARARPWSRPAA